MNVPVHRDPRRGSLITEAVVALAMLVTAVLPLSYHLFFDAKLCRAYYQRAVALEIVDGEMEILAAGEWRSFTPGRQSYSVKAFAATNLPAGEFVLNIDERRVRLEWLPTKRPRAKVMREVTIR